MVGSKGSVVGIPTPPTLCRVGHRLGHMDTMQHGTI